MKRMHGAVVGMVLAFSGAAFAAGMEGGSAASGETPMSVSSTDISSSYKSSELNGMSVQNLRKDELGTISDLYIDKDGKVSSVLLHEGGVAGIGGTQYLVPWDRVQLTAGEDIAVIDVEKDQLSSEFAAVEETKGATEKEKEKEKEKKVTGEKGKTEKPVAGTGKPSGTPGTGPK